MKQLISGIYKITSPNDRIYIGQSENIDKRWYLHRYKPKGEKMTFIHNSLNKYGWENHIFEIIEECDKKSLNLREIYWIDFYKSNIRKHKNKRGLNLTDGGTSGTRPKKKIYQYSLDNKLIKIWSSIEEVVDKLDYDKTGLMKCCQGKKNTANGYKWSYKKDKILEVIEKIFINGPVLQIGENSSIVEWDSPKQAAHHLSTKLNKRIRTVQSGIYHAINGKKKTYLGYIWKSKNPFSQTDFLNKKIQKNGKSVVQYNKGKLVKTWLSIREVVEKIDKQGRKPKSVYTGIYDCIRGRLKQYLGYEWKYK